MSAPSITLLVRSRIPLGGPVRLDAEMVMAQLCADAEREATARYGGAALLMLNVYAPGADTSFAYSRGCCTQPGRSLYPRRRCAMPLLPSDDPDMLILSVRCLAATIDAAFRPGYIFAPGKKRRAHQRPGS
jgi:hypothetical protein